MKRKVRIELTPNGIAIELAKLYITYYLVGTFLKLMALTFKFFHFTFIPKFVWNLEITHLF